MAGKIHTIDETIALIREGRRLMLAADESVLAQLPAGTWIGGTIPYFMGADGGVTSREVVYVDELPDVVSDIRIVTYGPDDLHRIPADEYPNGFSVVILPAKSEVHVRYAAEAPEYPGLFNQPIVGWVAGSHLDDVDTAIPKVYAGPTAEATSQHAVVLHASLPDGVLAVVDIVNLFHQGDGATLTFDDSGFSQSSVYVDGVATNLAKYLTEIGHDNRLPLVADYFGTSINVSIQNIDVDTVSFYAPVFKGVEYRLAAPIGDYVGEFEAHLQRGSISPTFACNCILNYVYSDLEGKKTGDIVGPITFGEVAYQLLNQTLVYLAIV
jgi:hypothetical protein